MLLSKAAGTASLLPIHEAQLDILLVMGSLGMVSGSMYRRVFELEMRRERMMWDVAPRLRLMCVRSLWRSGHGGEMSRLVPSLGSAVVVRREVFVSCKERSVIVVRYELMKAPIVCTRLWLSATLHESRLERTTALSELAAAAYATFFTLRSQWRRALVVS